MIDSILFLIKNPFELLCYTNYYVIDKFVETLKLNPMKTSILSSLLISTVLTFNSLTAHTVKKLKTINTSPIEFNITNFCNYLENGNANKVEGVYESSDGKYVFALIKNDARNHDFIGIVVSAENNRWKEGEIKFNFVLNKDTLNGFYYDDKGNPIPVQFAIGNDSLKTSILSKLSVIDIKSQMIAEISKKL